MLREHGARVGPVIPVEIVGNLPVRHAEGGERTVIQCLRTLPAGTQEHRVILFHKQREFPETTINPVVSCGQGNQIVVLRGTEADHQHVFRKVDIASVRILLHDRSNHASFTQHDLVFRAYGAPVFRIIEGERAEIHAVRQFLDRYQRFDLGHDQVGMEGSR